VARPAAKGEDTGGGGAGGLGRRLPVDARPPGCRADFYAWQSRQDGGERAWPVDPAAWPEIISIAVGDPSRDSALAPRADQEHLENIPRRPEES
jgi:hypothetical protein